MAAEQFGVGIGFSGQINAGRLDGTGVAFLAKNEATDMALMAVANYVLQHDGEALVSDGSGNTVKNEATDMALMAVANYVLQHDGEALVSDGSGNTVKITAEFVER